MGDQHLTGEVLTDVQLERTEEQKAALKVLEAARKRGIQMRLEHIEAMSAAYFLKTDTDPDKVELVEEMRMKGDGGYEIVWYFRERKRNRHKKQN